MIKTVLIDDEPAIRRDLKQLLDNHPDFLVVADCGSIKDALPVLKATQPQLVLLDIHLEDGDGFEILQHFQPIPFSVIFITAYNDYAIKAIKYGAMDYLLKPVYEEDLDQALLKVRAANHQGGTAPEQVDVTQSWLNKPANTDKPVATDRIVLRTQEYLQVVPLQEIIYCQSDAGYTYFFLTDKRKIVVSKSIKEYEEILPANLFIRSHQSYLVNYLFVDRFIKDGLLVLRTGQEIPVSSRRKDYVVQFLTGK